jgi:hypothetical protein
MGDSHFKKAHPVAGMTATIKQSGARKYDSCPTDGIPRTACGQKLTLLQVYHNATNPEKLLH